MDDFIKTIGDAIIEATKQVVEMSPEGDLVKSLKDQIRTLTAVNEEQKKTIEAQTKRISTLESCNAGRHDTIIDFKTQIEKLTAEKNALVEDVAKAAATNISLRSCEANLRSAEKALAEKDSELKAYQQTCDDLNKMLHRRSGDHVRKLERDIDVYQMEIEQRNKRIKDLEAQLGRQAKQIRTLNGQVPQTKSQRELQAKYNGLLKDFRAACNQRESYLRERNRLRIELNEALDKLKKPQRIEVMPAISINGVTYTSQEVAKLRDYNIKLIDELNKANKTLSDRDAVFITVQVNGRGTRFFKEDIQQLLGENRSLKQTSEVVCVHGTYRSIVALEAMEDENLELKTQLNNLRAVHARLTAAYNEMKSQSLIRIHNMDADIQVDGTDRRISVKQLVQYMNNVFCTPAGCVRANILNDDVLVCYENMEFKAGLIPDMVEAYANATEHKLAVIDGIIYHYKDIVRLADDNIAKQQAIKDLEKAIDALQHQVAELEKELNARKNADRIAKKIMDGRARVNQATTAFIHTAVGDVPCDSNGVRFLSDKLDQALAANKKALNGMLGAIDKLKESIT